MGAIAGAWRIEADATSADAGEISTSLVHRGNGPPTVWRAAGVVLAHTHFADLGTERAPANSMPYHDARTGLVVAGAVRIDNRAELCAELQLRSDPSVTDSGEIIAASYDRWGAQCAAQIVGDFAFAIWDEAERRMFCARDVFGVRPLYFHHAPGELFAWGSEIRPILRIKPELAVVNEASIADFLDGDLSNVTATAYRDVHRVPPAHCLTIDQSGLRLHQYWQFDPTYELDLESDAEYEQAYREHLVEAVRCRLPDTGPVGSFLSGGIDSSSVASIASTLLTQRDAGPLHTFSTVFDDVPASDERAYIDAVLSRPGFEPHQVDGSKLDALAELEERTDRYEGPFYAPNEFLVAAHAAAASTAGVHVMLDGFGGDSTTAHGWGRLGELARGMRWIKLWREIWAFDGQLTKPPAVVYRNLVLVHGLRSRLPRRLVGPLRKLRDGLRPPGPESTLLRPDFASRVAAKRPSPEAHVGHSGQRLTARDKHLENLAPPAMATALEITDKLGAAFGVEFRYPFLDRRLAAFCLALPADQKLRDGWTRSIARRSLGDYLPDEVQWRPDKANLGHNFRYVLATLGRHHIEAALDEQSSNVADYVDVSKLHPLLDRLAPTSPGIEADTLWRVAVANAWIAGGHAADDG